MNENEHRELREMLGAFVLGGLSPDESLRTREHLETCASCRADLEQLTPVARELAQLSPLTQGDAWTARHGLDDVPAGLGDRVSAAIAAERRRRGSRHGLRLGVVAVASAAVAASIAVVVVQAQAPEPVPLEAVAVQVDETGVRADADLVNHTWGVEIKLAASGLDAGETYRVAIVTDDGAERPAGEFIGTGEVEMHCNLNSSVLRTDAAGFVVVDDAGVEVISSTFAG